MWWRRSMSYWIKVTILFLIVSIGCMGCGKSESNTIETNNQQVQRIKEYQKKISKESREIAYSYRDIYKQAAKQEELGELNTIKKIVKCLGESGYAVVDQDNQVDMENSKEVIEFVEKVDQKKKAKLVIFCVRTNGGFIRYNLESNKGKTKVIPSALTWEKETPKVVFLMEYMAHGWTYSKEGYLFFEKEQMPGLCLGHTGIRVKKLEEKCKEMNRKYILPIGYDGNDLFLKDWSEPAYSNVNFYDLYEKIYPSQHGKPVPYESDYSGKFYQIPRKEFEDVIMSRFAISEQTLQEQTTYDMSADTYEYRPRGQYDGGIGGDVPYPEVVAYSENSDGTIHLTVNAVWPKVKRANVLSHEVVVRPLLDGSFQYISNHVVQSNDNMEAVWYVNRLTKEQWEKYYGSN